MSTPIEVIAQRQRYVGNTILNAKKLRFNGLEGWEVSIAGGSSPLETNYWIQGDRLYYSAPDLNITTRQVTWSFHKVPGDIDPEDRRIIFQSVELWQAQLDAEGLDSTA